MLRIAVQAKGRLFEETMALLEESDIKLSATKRTLLVQSTNFPVEVLFLRDDDIPQSVATGVADLGIVGENEFVEKGEDAEIIKRLGFSKCRLSLAMPKDIEYPGVEWFAGKKIATSYPVILNKYMKEKGVSAEIHVITGLPARSLTPKSAQRSPLWALTSWLPASATSTASTPQTGRVWTSRLWTASTRPPITFLWFCTAAPASPTR